MLANSCLSKPVHACTYVYLHPAHCPGYVQIRVSAARPTSQLEWSESSRITVGVAASGTIGAPPLEPSAGFGMCLIQPPSLTSRTPFNQAHEIRELKVDPYRAAGAPALILHDLVDPEDSSSTARVEPQPACACMHLYTLIYTSTSYFLMPMYRTPTH